ncbi:MAG: rod shape-determining protein MreC [Bacteroidetes bacterium HGW-Bacteroidetes-15]|nr:MAG: rod shape-determining protein MreC [Bacteroidetes bacterium HGW-Bacteroidetes-15]
MNSLIRFIVKYQFFLLFIVLEFFSFWLLVNHSYYQRSKFENVARNIFGYSSNKLDNVKRYLLLHEDNLLLAKENLDLRNQIASLSSILESQNKLIKDTIAGSQFTFSAAKVINNSVNKHYNYLTLNVGKKDGVTQEMGVISNEGIVGIVAGVSENYSTVISLLNVDLKISAKLKKTNHFGSLFWDGKNYREVVLGDIPQHVLLVVGDTVVTSGFSSIFPPNINLGTIKSFDAKGSNFHTIKVQLFNDFKKLHNVWVVKNIHDNEREVLENSIIQN